MLTLKAPVTFFYTRFVKPFLRYLPVIRLAGALRQKRFHWWRYLFVNHHLVITDAENGAHALF